MLLYICKDLVTTTNSAGIYVMLVSRELLGVSDVPMLDATAASGATLLDWCGQKKQYQKSSGGGSP